MSGCDVNWCVLTNRADVRGETATTRQVSGDGRLRTNLCKWQSQTVVQLLLLGSCSSFIKHISVEYIAALNVDEIRSKQRI